ncbi:translation initiation factor IF-2 [Methyloglobulus sp.]|uniref:translation initiation factor IF-2 n=1 Tax=Methyloglobulus sp. TaxID=2518622 RepID=UPI0032B7EC25
MSDKTVRELAEVVKIPLERLLEQLKEAGLSVSTADEVISDDDQTKLLTHLRSRHGKPAGEPEKQRVTLVRTKHIEIKQATAPGSSTKTINVEFRKTKNYINVKQKEEQETAELELIEQTPTPEIIAQTEPQTVAKDATKTAEHEPKEAVSPAPELTVTEPQLQALENVTTNTVIEPILAATPDATKATSDKQEKPLKPKEAEAPKKKLDEKERRLEESIKRNSERVKQQAEGKKETLHRKKTDDDGRSVNYARKGKKKPKSPARGSNQSDGKHQFEMPVAPMIKEVTIPETIIVSDLAQKMSLKAALVIKHLMKLGIMATINQSIDQDTAAILVEELGHKAIMQNDDDFEQDMLTEAQQEDNRIPVPRAPIVTIMGHVDHGKTSLLDYIRKTRVAAGEAGGITQHIGAYQVKTDHGAVTFLDTPGHAAFTAMRARGADVTDVVIVVVAADDGVMPQTKEAVEHARAANVPIIVAMNKIDKPDANPDKVMQELSNINVVPEEWGGDVQFLKISAKTGEGIDELIEALIVQTEILELKAPAEGAASGIVIESRLDKGRGAVATVLIQKGTLESGQMVLCGHEFGRVRAMFNENGKSIKEAGPCVPVEILGLSGTPFAGDEFLVVQNERVAKDLAKHREDRKRSTKHAAQSASKLDEVFSRMATGEIASVNLVLKTDVQGSLEALRGSLVDLSNEEVEVKVIYGGVGGINEGDVNLALASGAILMGFNVRADATSRRIIEEKGVDLHYYSVIYDAIDEVKKSISGMLAPEIKETIVGLAEVRDVFKSPKFGAIAGCMVVDGFVKRNLPIRVLRNNVVIYEGQLESLRRFKDDAAEVKMGMECGIGVKNYNDVQPGDQIEVFERTEIKRVL